MNQEVIKAISIRVGDFVVIGGNELLQVISIIESDFSDSEREYLFGDNRTAPPFYNAKKITLSTCNANNEPIIIIFASTDSVSVVAVEK